jgi:cytochrome c biogenesis protein CcdA
VGPTLYLASGHDAGRSLLGFIAGVFAVSAAAGVVLVVGPGHALLAHRPSPHTEHLVEVCAGIILVALAMALWLARSRVVRNEGVIQRISILVGAAIMAVELPTALPYFAVIAAVAGSGRAVTTQVVLILLFNLVFAAPRRVRQLAGARGMNWLAATRERLERHAELLVPALVLLVAAILLALGTAGLAGGQTHAEHPVDPRVNEPASQA